MASNALPDDRNKLYVMADSILAGLTMYEAALGVTQNTAAKIRPLLEVRDAGGNLTMPPVANTGARNWDFAFANARNNKAAAFTAIANVHDTDATVAAPPAGVSAEYCVEGINAAGHGPPSDTVATGP